MDTQTDLLNLLTSDDNVESSAVSDTEVAVCPQSPVEAPCFEDSLEVFEDLLFTDSLAVEDSITADINDVLSQLNEAGLENLLLSELDTSVSDAPILSPVSAIDIESVLSSSPSSPENSVPSIFDSIADQQISVNKDEIKTNTINSNPHRNGKSRPSPYAKSSRHKGRSSDRKERKKEQNRNAALRYRQKKREEEGTTCEEYNEVKEKNDKLKDHVDSLTREIHYLKDLMAEVFKAKHKGKK